MLAGDDVDARDLEQAIRIAKESHEASDMDELVEKAKNAREAKEREEEEKRKLSTHRKADAVSMRAVDVDLFDGSRFDAFRDYTPSHPHAATQKQVAFLIKLGVSPEKATNVSKRQAGAMIDSMQKQTGGDFIITFGKYAGKKLSQIPKQWMEWAKQNVDRKDVRDNIVAFLSPTPPTHQTQHGASDEVPF